ncbi:MAG: NAD(P)H-hydrate epimerase [Nitrososphaerales archaeon]
MRGAISSEEMKRIEDRGARIGITKLMMMENAGKSLSDQVFNCLKSETPCKVVIVAGTGNNGGDALVAARHLAYWKEYFQVIVVLLGKPEKIQASEAKANWDIVSKIHRIKKVVVDSNEKIDLLIKQTKGASLLVVGIFGTGFKGKPRDLQLEAIKQINASKAIKLCVDIPSGMEADSGACDYSINSDLTVAMHAPKLGMMKGKARKKVGKLIIANIGVAF